MDFNFFPPKILLPLLRYEYKYLTEIRLRVNFPIILNYKNNRTYLTDFNNKIYCKQNDIEEIISNVTERSIYAFNDKIKEGFLTTKDGNRIGIAGECVFENGKIVTIKNITSLNVRIAHDVPNSSKNIYDKLFTTKIYNTLIISPPAKGKTTILKDLANKLNDTNLYSILLIDERGEMIGVKGENIDKMNFCDKTYAFSCAIRSMSPEIVIIDELSSEHDWKCAKSAISSGVKIIATAHGESIEDLTKKEYFINSVFDKYVVLRNSAIPGQVKNIFDKDFNAI